MNNNTASVGRSLGPADAVFVLTIRVVGFCDIFVIISNNGLFFKNICYNG